MEMNVTGACHCGNIQFTAEVDASRVVVCHCTDCQTLSGSAFRVNAPAPVGSFKLTRGQPKTYVKVAESGAQRLHGFCPDCGTPLYSVAPVDPKLIFLRLGAIHQRHALSPTFQIWRRSEVNWLHELEAVPGSSEQQALVAK
jgi:hypothetical protein